MRHLGLERAYQLAKERVFWPGMEDIIHFVTRICSCVKKKPPHIKPVAPIRTITTTLPMEIVRIDFLYLGHCFGGYECLLVVTEHFTWYMLAYPITNKASRTAAERNFNDFIITFGMHKHVFHDQGKEFENKLFHQSTKLGGVKQLRTTP